MIRTPSLALLLIALSALIAWPSAAEPAPLPPQPAAVPWPTEAWPQGEPSAGIDRECLSSATAKLFRETGRAGDPDTRALLVVERGLLVAEQYAPGFDRSVRFPSCSLAKGFTNAIVGILVGRGALELDAPAVLPGWGREGDPRGAITLRQLLQMTSGLDNADDGLAPGSRLSRMLYGDGSADMASFAANVPLIHAPGARWAYSTASSMLVARVAQRAVGEGRQAMLDFMREALFVPTGMKSAIPEFDHSGTFVGGASIHATARDFARLGLLYLRDGIWDGRRILPAGWVALSTQPAPAKDNCCYGAHFSIAPDRADERRSVDPGRPARSFSARGHQGQRILIEPGRDLVLVRLGLLQGERTETLDHDLASMVGCFPTAPQQRSYTRSHGDAGEAR